MNETTETTFFENKEADSILLAINFVCTEVAFGLGLIFFRNFFFLNSMKNFSLIYFFSTPYFQKRAYTTFNAHYRKCRTFFCIKQNFFFVMMMSQVVIALALFFIQITHTARQYRGPEMVEKN